MPLDCMVDLEVPWPESAVFLCLSFALLPRLKISLKCGLLVLVCLVKKKFLLSFRSLEERYNLASVTRNNLVAASQNIQGAQRYLSNIVFPYCAPSEVETLNKVYFQLINTKFMV